MNKELENQLELLVDRYSLRFVLEALAAVAHAKAEHLITNWQDPGAGDMWQHAAKNIEEVSWLPI